MLMHPVFIAVPEGVEVFPKDSPTLVEDGSSLELYFKSSTPNKLLKNIKINGQIVVAEAYQKTIRIDNIIGPKFVTVGDALVEQPPDEATPVVDARSRGSVSGSLPSPVFTTYPNTGAGTSEPCCGIKSVKLAMQEDGSVVGTVSGFASDVYDIMDYVMSGSPTASGGSGYKVTSWREDGVITTLTAMSIVTDAYEKLPTSAVFRTVPTEIYDLYLSQIIPRSIQNPLDTPDTEVYIRPSDTYGTDGWTVQDILDTLRIDANVPSAFNYHVYQLTVTRGAPVISLMYNLLPIPGLVIERQVSWVSEQGTLASYYITVAKGRGSFSGNTCKTVGSSSTTEHYMPTVVGLLGEPLYIEEVEQPDEIPPPPEAPDAQGTKLTLNLIGGVFGIDKDTTVSVANTAIPLNITGENAIPIYPYTAPSS